jgi:hypothetical protein
MLRNIGAHEAFDWRVQRLVLITAGVLSGWRVQYCAQ